MESAVTIEHAKVARNGSDELAIRPFYVLGSFLDDVSNTSENFTAPIILQVLLPLDLLGKLWATQAHQKSAPSIQ